MFNQIDTSNDGFGHFVLFLKQRVHLALVGPFVCLLLDSSRYSIQASASTVKLIHDMMPIHAYPDCLKE